ncbi:alpha-2,8-sialyltransferase 8B-like [Saccoglossus kowalevskii]|uniref:Alpha-2,8-sialyltransferase 8E-like n=1 Tax=Saccoglossus kowalevskii TaxID=10224 RepID=A0ABM0MBR0_SACKO|nr:PREDICTED: alpha-2,8-sialyltransferase 8E-like [Saccoglossus kowalevskii]
MARLMRWARRNKCFCILPLAFAVVMVTVNFGIFDLSDVNEHNKSPIAKSPGISGFTSFKLENKEKKSNNSRFHHDVIHRGGRFPDKDQKVVLNQLLLLRKNISGNIVIDADIRVFKNDTTPKYMHFFQDYQDKYVKHDPEFKRLANATRPLRQSKSCSVVLSEKALIHSRCGDQIELSPFVIRRTLTGLQDDKTNDIGFKTDLALLDSTLLQSLYDFVSENPRRGARKSSNLKLFSTVQKLNGTILLYPWRLERTSRERNNIRFMTLRLRERYQVHLQMAYSPLKPFSVRVSEYWKIANSTSDLTLVTLAVLLCDTIHVYGAPIHEKKTSDEGDIVKNILTGPGATSMKEVFMDLQHAGIIHVHNTCHA